MASWGLYGDLPPPSTGGTTPATPSASSNGAEPGKSSLKNTYIHYKK